MSQLNFNWIKNNWALIFFLGLETLILLGALVWLVYISFSNE